MEKLNNIFFALMARGPEGLIFCLLYPFCSILSYLLRKSGYI